MKERLLDLLQFDSCLSSKEYHWYELENGIISFRIESTRKYETIEREFTKDEFGIVKLIFKLE